MADDDIKMNSFAQATDAAYIYAESSNGSQVKIKKSDLVEVIRAAMPIVTNINKGLMPPNAIIYKGLIGENDMRDVGSSFGYSYGNMDGSSIAGPYLSLEVVQGYMFQLKVDMGLKALKFRIYNKDSDYLSPWKSITFT